MISYRLSIKPDDNGTLLVTSPDLPLATFAEDRDAALMHARDAAQAILASLMSAGQDVPPSAGATSGDSLTLPL